MSSDPSTPDPANLPRRRSSNSALASSTSTSSVSSSPLPTYNSHRKHSISKQNKAGWWQSLMTFVNSKARKGTSWWRAVAVFALLLLAFVWFMLPDDRSAGDISSKLAQNGEVAPVDKVEAPVLSAPANTEVLTSSHCTVGHPGKRLIQYALMLDAGSTGSRIHIYRFNYCKENPELEDEIFEQIKPGLSSYPNDPVAAAKSLDVLMNIALEKVPKSLHKCTPVAVKATAGLRILGQVKSEQILKAVRKRLESAYPFPLAKHEAVAIMDGKDEGVYAWITVNYLLGNLNGSKKRSTAAIFDLGGGSTQIVFEPTFIDTDRLAEGEHKYELSYGDHKYSLYQHSYLGYGLMEARKQIKNYVFDMWKLHRANPDNSETDDRTAHPCLPQNYTEVWPSIDTGKDQESKLTVTLYGTAAGHAQCRAITEHIMNKDKTCPLTPCSFDGIYQPSLAVTFEKNDIYAFSFFYDRTQPLGMPSEFSVKELRVLTDSVCAAEFDSFEHVPGALEELKTDPTYCMDLSFIYGLLHFGYEIPEDRMVKIAKKINGAETGWCLGAAIALLNEVSWCDV